MTSRWAYSSSPTRGGRPLPALDPLASIALPAPPCPPHLCTWLTSPLPRPGVHRLDADHPDKDGLQLRAISHVLKIFDKEAKEEYGAGCKVGVFLDYVSMPQRSRGSAEDDRTPEEKATFDRALKVRRAPTSLAAHTAPCLQPASHSPQRLPAPLGHRP